MFVKMTPWASLQQAPGTQAPFVRGAYEVPTNIPAYTPVQVRQTFEQTTTTTPYYDQPAQLQTPPAPVQSPPQRKTKIDWPQSVRNYVQRSFDPANTLPDVPKADMEEKLKMTISHATDTGALNTIDWDNLPLPQHMIRTERARGWAAPPLPPAGMGTFGNGFTSPSQDTFARKRKSQEVAGGNEEDQGSSPPWRSTNNNRNVFEDRITYPSKPIVNQFDKRQQPFQEESPNKASKFQKNLEKRQKRFDGGYKSTYKRSPTPEASTGPVVGTCQVLEKRYFRLTSAPNPAQVRPLDVLKQTLEVLKKKWRKESNYSYICDQFKSLRQDLTVQHIKNDFTVTVYEIHARIALEKGDLGEYNQCQTQLRSLYAQNLGGHPVEFKAYRILYFIHTCNRTALNDVLADLTTAEKEEKAIKHALNVRSALALGNYHRFFRLYLETPNMGAYLMDMFVVRERLAALSNICKAYKPDVKLRFITEELGFESDGDAVQFIIDHNGQNLLEECEDGIRLLTGKAGTIFEAARGAAFRKVDIKGQI